MPDKGASGNVGFVEWLEHNNIPQRTAYNLIRDAKSTDVQRAGQKAAEAERKRTERAAKKEKLPTLKAGSTRATLNPLSTDT